MAPKVLKKITVDLWATDLHSAEIGIRKQEVHQSKERQFSKDMELFAQVEEDGEKIAYLGFRKEAWKANPQEQRLVIKSFTDKINWIGSLEEMVAIEFTRSMAAERSVPSFIVNIAEHKPLIHLEATIPREIWPGDTYNFYLFHPEQKILNPFRIREDRLTVGSDWNVNDVTQKKIAKIDGKKFNVGGKFDIEIYDDQIKDDDVFIQTLILFSGMLKFRKKIEKRIDDFLDKMREKKAYIELSKEEVKLYQNPRRLAY
ncbi:MAG: hypothetical protein GF308_17350 [Candidatus Heimdallarchaeota archaeon]|nr:hypothetical protein [Candidatus Heimdallarchaeota archaeon]